MGKQLRLDFLRGTTKRATRFLTHMHTLRTTLALLALASCAAFAAPADIADSLADYIKKPVTLRVTPLEKSDLPDGGDRATAESRLSRAQENWRRLMLARTQEAVSAPGARVSPGTRTFGEYGYWNLVVDGSVDDETLRILERRTRAIDSLRGRMITARRAADMEPDSIERTQLIQAIDGLVSAIDGWKSSKNGAMSSRASIKSGLSKISALRSKVTEPKQVDGVLSE